MTESEGEVWWCDECQAYECPYCGDFNADDPAQVEAHFADCPDRPEVCA